MKIKLAIVIIFIFVLTFLFRWEIKLVFFRLISKHNGYDLSIVGPVNPLDSVSNQALLFSDIYSEWLDYNLIPSYRVNKASLPRDILKRISQIQVPGKVVLYTGIIPHYASNNSQLDGLFKLLKKSHTARESQILIAYTMFESTSIPRNWVRTLNDYFDVVVVPDEFWIDIYKNSGVTKPIFTVPLPVTENTLDLKKKSGHQKFVFGNLSSTQNRKNHIRLIEAFKIVNQKKPNTFLYLNTRTLEETDTKKEIYEFIKQSGVKNLSFVSEVLSQEAYKEYIQKVDVFVYPSKGEGFAIQPRESMAMGIPTIITNNTSQSTICKSGLAICIKSDIRKAAFYEFMPPLVTGNNFDCTADDLADAMIDVYDNYEKYAAKGDQMRQWVIDNYSPDALRAKYINMVKPKKVILGDRNEITDEHLMTDSKELYEKYSKISN